MCGANFYDIDTNRFIYIQLNNNITIKKYSLLNHIISESHIWLYIVYKIHNNENKVTY